MSEAEMRIKILDELAEEWDAEYDRLTLKSGAYGNMKVRAAYRLAAGLAAHKAKKLKEEQSNV